MFSTFFVNYDSSRMKDLRILVIRPFDSFKAENSSWNLGFCDFIRFLLFFVKLFVVVVPICIVDLSTLPLTVGERPLVFKLFIGMLL